MSLDSSNATIRLSGRAVIYSRDPQTCARLAEIVIDQTTETVRTSDIGQLGELLCEESFGCCILDEPPDVRQVAELEWLVRTHHQPTQFIVLPAIGQREQFRAQSFVACEVLDPPLTRDKLRGAVFTALGRSHLISENQQLKRKLLSRGVDDMVGQSHALLQLRDDLQQLAEDRTPVLVTGEPGVGTTVVARALHRARFGSRKPIVRVRCQVLCGTAIEQELFGEAPDGSDSRLLQAAGGTLLLDDIDAVSLTTQERLVRVLRESTVRTDAQDGGPAPACIIATTHIDLRAAVQDGRFRADLLEAISGHVVKVPALRNRVDDIGVLSEHFLAEYAAREGKPALRLTADALELLKRHNWPGNVRELKNVLERCCAIETGAELHAATLSTWIERPAEDVVDETGLTLREMERKLIEATFNRFGGNREMTAKALQIGLRTLSGKLREYGYPPRGGPGSNRIARAA
ncbi:MAG: sigma-54-dependent Fis family transcriptional regulator [Planctomycetaceae bacterium]|nr:sigma-54-dependent Fis family transcriptional regulator [Planctomycetaceae bacterium]